MSATPQPDDQFTDMTAGDPVRARQLRTSLQTILDRSNDSTLREMAREVLSGRLSLRDAAKVPAYGEAMRAGMQQGLRAYEEMSESERREAEEEGRRQLDQVQAELDEEQRERNRAQGGSGTRPGKHSGRGWSL